MKMYANIVYDFRGRFIHKIIFYRKKFLGIYRSTECLAISISDKFLNSLKQSSKLQPLIDLDVEQYTLTMLWIACKFHGYRNLKIASFVQETSSQEDHEEVRKKMLSLEKIILYEIDFEIPTYTAYDLLDFQIPPAELQSKKSKEKILVCLKIFMNSMESSPHLSLMPHVGKEFYSITLNGEGSKLALKLYNQSRESLKKRKQRSES